MSSDLDIAALPDVLAVPLPSVQSGAFAPLKAQPLPSDRYLVFDAAASASLDQQQATLLFFLDLAITLGRTLVLPRCRLRRLLPSGEPAADATLIPWSDLFDLTTLAELHPAVPIDSFVASHGRLDLLTSASADGCSTSAAAVEFNGLAALPVTRSECAVRHSAAALRSRAEVAIAFVGSSDALDASRDRELRTHIRFARSVYAEAAAFVRERFAGQPFASVHWSAAGRRLLALPRSWRGSAWPGRSPSRQRLGRRPPPSVRPCGERPSHHPLLRARSGRSVSPWLPAETGTAGAAKRAPPFWTPS